MYYASRSISPSLTALSNPPFPRRTFQRQRDMPRSAPGAVQPVYNLAHDTAPRATRIFGYTVPAFVAVLVITLMCAVLPDLKGKIPTPTLSSHASAPTRVVDSWAYGLRGN